MSKIHDNDLSYLMPGIQQIASESRLVIERGKGALLFDEEGKRYIDMFAGVGVCSIGHGNPRFVKEVSDQLNKVVVGSYTTPVRVELLQLLAAVTPQGLDRIQFFSGGSEAVEAALRLAKSFTKRKTFVSFWGAFHGKTLGALGLCGTGFRSEHNVKLAGYHLVPYADCYRCSFSNTYPNCELACVNYARDFIFHTLAGEIAAIIVEPIQGTNGNIVPPKNFMPALRELASELGALLIVDEMITGLGRTGKMFYSSESNINADILIIGKGMANGLPMSAIISKEPIVSAPPFSTPSGCSSSFGGNPLSCAGALATLNIILDEKLEENAQKVGEYFLQSLSSMESRYPFVGKIQGQGLMIGIELVNDKITKSPLNRDITLQIFHRLLRRGILMMAYGPKIRINPPLCINQELCEETLTVMQDVFSSIMTEYF